MTVAGQLKAAAARRQFTVTLIGFEAMPFATTASELGPVSIEAGTSKLVETIFDPVATPIVLWSCVRA